MFSEAMQALIEQYTPSLVRMMPKLAMPEPEHTPHEWPWMTSVSLGERHSIGISISVAKHMLAHDDRVAHDIGVRLYGAVEDKIVALFTQFERREFLAGSFAAAFGDVYRRSGLHHPHIMVVSKPEDEHEFVFLLKYMSLRRYMDVAAIVSNRTIHSVIFLSNAISLAISPIRSGRIEFEDVYHLTYELDFALALHDVKLGIRFGEDTDD